MLDYEWDPAKAVASFKKHGVHFADAVGVMDDDLALTRGDTSADEDRQVTLGRDAVGRGLVVVHTLRSERVVRIISARRATPRERASYER